MFGYCQKLFRVYIIHTHIATYVCTYIHTYISTYIRTYIHANIHIHTHTHIYIYAYMYICMYTCICAVQQVCKFLVLELNFTRNLKRSNKTHIYVHEQTSTAHVVVVKYCTVIAISSQLVSLCDR